MIREPWKLPDEQIDREYFEKHKAIASRNEILWRQNGTRINLVRFTIVADRYLVVTGDLGEAVYQWGESITFQFLAGLSLSYFASKCQASEHGRGYESWSDELARKCLQEDVDRADESEERAQLAKKAIDAGAYEDLHSWTRWVFDESIEDGRYEQYWEQGHLGMRPDIRCQIQLRGLKLAFKAVSEHMETLRQPA